MKLNIETWNETPTNIEVYFWDEHEQEFGDTRKYSVNRDILGDWLDKKGYLLLVTSYFNQNTNNTEEREEKVTAETFIRDHLDSSLLKQYLIEKLNNQ